MNTSLFIWAVLVNIAVSDAKTHRIPNKLLALLLMLMCLSTLIQTHQLALGAVFLDKGAAFGIAFTFSLGLYLIRVMAPGDVKLIAVLGFFLGTEQLVSYFFYVCVSTAFVGSMYWLLNRLNLATRAELNMDAVELVGYMVLSMQLRRQASVKKITVEKALTYMPFAPILVIGLALHQYYT